MKTCQKVETCRIVNLINSTEFQQQFTRRVGFEQIFQRLI